MEYYLLYRDGKIIGSSNLPVIEEGTECRQVTNEEYIAYINISQQKRQNQDQIDDLKDKLQSTDWIVIKINEMETEKEKQILREKYKNELLERKQWREEINKLEEKIKEA